MEEPPEPPRAVPSDDGAVPRMVAGIALFLLAGFLFQNVPAFPPKAGVAMGVIGMACYAWGWWRAFRAKINADWFSRALNILGAVFFYILGGMLLAKLLAA
ncbi:MAG: hypothetical protein KIS92_00070 [Planctomycetota bacterium]|nr:hypothetical protein [Planctomycetota bacterium]